MKFIKNRLKRTKGFTLIELLAVVVILSVFLSLTIVLINFVINDSKKNATEVSLKSIANAAKIYAQEFKTDSADWEMEKGSLNQYTCTTIKQLKNYGFFRGN